MVCLILFTVFVFSLVKEGHGPISPVHDIPLWVDKQKVAPIEKFEFFYTFFLLKLFT
jgi:hypothetical protein